MAFINFGYFGNRLGFEDAYGHFYVFRFKFGFNYIFKQLKLNVHT